MLFKSFLFCFLISNVFGYNEYNYYNSIKIENEINLSNLNDDIILTIFKNDDKKIMVSLYSQIHNCTFFEKDINDINKKIATKLYKFDFPEVYILSFFKEKDLTFNKQLYLKVNSLIKEIITKNEMFEILKDFNFNEIIKIETGKFEKIQLNKKNIREQNLKTWN